MLARQGWRIVQNPDSLCAQLLRAKYGTNDSLLQAKEVHGIGKESAVGGGSRHVRGDGMTPMVFKALLHFIYTDSLSDEETNSLSDDETDPPSDEEADHGLRIAISAADRYDMERLKLICSDMLCSYIDATTAVHTLQLAHKHWLSQAQPGLHQVP
jgi:speckle-type POZ protein